MAREDIFGKVARLSPSLAAVSGADRLAAQYYLYKMMTSVGFPNPIWQLYLLSRGLSFAQIFAPDVIYRVTVLLAEIPTGCLGDRLGRRNGLVVSCLLIAGSVFAFGLANSFASFVGIYLVWAIGTTFQSGTASAWLYDSFAEYEATDTFATARGRGNAAQLTAAGISAVIGGYLANLGLFYPFLASSVLTALGVGSELFSPSLSHGLTLTTARIR